MYHRHVNSGCTKLRCVSTLVRNVGEGSDALKQSSLTKMGYLAQTEDKNLQNILSRHSNDIFIAVVQGAHEDKFNNDVMLAAIIALGHSLEFLLTRASVTRR